MANIVQEHRNVLIMDSNRKVVEDYLSTDVVWDVVYSVYNIPQLEDYAHEHRLSLLNHYETVVIGIGLNDFRKISSSMGLTEACDRLKRICNRLKTEDNHVFLMEVPPVKCETVKYEVGINVLERDVNKSLKTEDNHVFLMEVPPVRSYSRNTVIQRTNTYLCVM